MQLPHELLNALFELHLLCMATSPTEETHSDYGCLRVYSTITRAVMKITVLEASK